MPPLSPLHPSSPEAVELRDALDRWLRDPKVASLELDVPSRTLRARALAAPSVATGDVIDEIARPGIAPQAFEAAVDAAITRAITEARPAGMHVRYRRGCGWITAFIAVQSLEDLLPQRADAATR